MLVHVVTQWFSSCLWSSARAFEGVGMSAKAVKTTETSEKAIMMGCLSIATHLKGKFRVALLYIYLCC